MATQATLEQWEELYDLAIEITKLKALERLLGHGFNCGRNKEK